ncbi:endonuclease/exonuclease/phosphatase family protein [Capnocytophaga sp. ARDL2]|uniref:endonuclease/exonuclease/phosphatase family protein n=1 Tax=Capnocytophaga sp. ARDL2 TaxID=3238809 RepID=UPI0035560176
MFKKKNILYTLVLFCLFALFSVKCGFSQQKNYLVHTVAFYNLENLFDIIDDPKKFDDEFTPNGAKSWDKHRYEQKLKNLSKVLSEIGYDQTKQPPTVIGVCEIENQQVLQDLVNQPLLKPYNYGIVHYDSPDNRGIDVALLYRKDYFTPTNTQRRPLLLFENDKKSPNGKKRVFTRDQLVVSGKLENEDIHFVVSHWPSRGGGEKKSEFKRKAAANLNRNIIDSLSNRHKEAKVITMGDFNDTPSNYSVDKILNISNDKNDVSDHQLYNVLAHFYKKGEGTIAYRDTWMIFDHLIITPALLNNEYNSYKLWKSGIFRPSYLIESKGKYKGYPLRNKNDGTPGYSDHFPVYLYLIKEKRK